MDDKGSYIYALAYLLILLLDINEINARKDCVKLDISITQKIENLGFHRDLNWLIETRNLGPKQWANASCDVAIRMQMGQDVFVNPDQAEDLRRLGKLDIMINGTVDVEAPAHDGLRHIVYIFLNSSQIPDKTTVKLPIHLRYQRSLMGGHGRVILSKPNLLVHCLKSNSLICGKHSKVIAPTSSKDFETLRIWKNVTYVAQDFGEMELLVPIGNLDDYACVAVVSCILGCMGCVYILSLLSDVEKED